MNIHSDSKDSLSLNLLIDGNSPDAKSLAVLAELDISASIIASARLPRSRWSKHPVALDFIFAPGLM